MLNNEKNKKLFILVISTITICILVSITLGYSKASTKNEFDITKSDSFSMSHLYNVNGVVGYEKTDFSEEEIRIILKFLNSLKLEKILETNVETRYGIPPDLTVYKNNCTIRIQLYSKDFIEFSKEDSNGNVISRKQYKTTAKQLENMFVIIGLPEKETNNNWY